MAPTCWPELPLPPLPAELVSQPHCRPVSNLTLNSATPAVLFTLSSGWCTGSHTALPQQMDGVPAGVLPLHALDGEAGRVPVGVSPVLQCTLCSAPALYGTSDMGDDNLPEDVCQEIKRFALNT